jgi:predicted Zn-dependent protease
MQAAGVANSNGLFAYNRHTSSSFSVTAMTKDSSGRAEDTRRDINAPSDRLMPSRLRRP